MLKAIKSLRIFIMVAAIVMSISAVCFAGPQDFVLVNNTGYPIYQVNISPASSNDWQEDVLGKQILNNGEALQVGFNSGNVQMWDINAIFEDGSSIAWYGIDLLSTSQVTLNKDGSASLE